MDSSTIIGLIGLVLGLGLIYLLVRRVTSHRSDDLVTPTVNDPNASNAYQQFFREYISSDGNYNAWHDGLNERIFDQMLPAERERAETLLIKTLPDWRAIIGLGVIRSRKAIVPLEKLRSSVEGEKLVNIEQALMRIRAEKSEGGARIRAVLSSGREAQRTADARMGAARALSEFPSAETSSALLEAIRHDTQYLVRYHATHSLLHIYGYSNNELNALMAELAPALSYGGTAGPKVETIQRIEALIAGKHLRT